MKEKKDQYDEMLSNYSSLAYFDEEQYKPSEKERAMLSILKNRLYSNFPKFLDNEIRQTLRDMKKEGYK